MNYKDLMMESLTELLINDEVLKYPIYGILNQGGMQYYGFFGLTDTHLLIALVSGKQITYTTRVPLDVKSVKIKQTKIFKQYVIDISFNEGSPCRITASPKVLMIDAQKQNLPRFLELFKGKSPNKREIELKDENGEKIRWQYFNTYIYVMLCFVPMPLVITIVMRLLENNLNMAEILSAFPTAAIIWGVFLAPFVVLSLLNRFFFGKIIAVAREDGLLFENDFIPWNAIKKITFNPQVCSRFEMHYTYATILVESPEKAEYAIDIMHFPLYGLRKIKKYNPEIKIELGRSGLVTILLFALAPTLISIIIPLIK